MSGLQKTIQGLEMPAITEPGEVLLDGLFFGFLESLFGSTGGWASGSDPETEAVSKAIQIHGCLVKQNRR